MTVAAGQGGLFRVIETVPGLPDAVIGLGIGTIFGKLVVRRLEKGGGELRPSQVRRIEGAWIAAWVLIALALRVAAALP